MSRTYCHTHGKYDCPTCADEILSLGIQSDKDRIAALEREIDGLQSRMQMTPDQIKTIIHAQHEIETLAVDAIGNDGEVERIMSLSADLERIVWEAGYHCRMDDGELIPSHICLCAAHSAYECACGAWDVEVPE